LVACLQKDYAPNELLVDAGTYFQAADLDGNADCGHPPDCFLHDQGSDSLVSVFLVFYLL